MSVGKSFERLCLILISSFLFWGCMGHFREGQLQQISSWPPESPKEKKSISIIVSGEAIVEGVEHEANANMIETWRAHSVKAYKDSALFSEVYTGFEDSDLRAHVKIFDRGEVTSGSPFLTGLTMYLIPTTVDDEFTVTTTFKNSEGKNLGSITKIETVNTVLQFFMIFALGSGSAVIEETIYDLNRATIIEANSQNFISR